MYEMLVPLPWQGHASDVSDPEVAWLQQLPANTYCALWQRWPTDDLPKGYDRYVVSFHLEAVDCNWVNRQAQLVQAPVILLSDSHYYNYPFHSNVQTYTYVYWHKQLEKMTRWHGVQSSQPTKKYKFSAVCNRITQSKLWITTRLLDVARQDSLIVLNDWFNDKNVHNWHSTGRPMLDQLTQRFQDQYFGTTIKIDDFTNDLNYQEITSNPWQPLYTDCAINFTNESFHYSYMSEPVEHIYPGPFITEKTFKPLLAGTAFVPVGQFETYKVLEQLGFEFEYKFNTGWDSDSGNLSRMQSIIQTLDQLTEMDLGEIIAATEQSNIHNQQHIISGNFASICNQHNQIVQQKLLDEN